MIKKKIIFIALAGLFLAACEPATNATVTSDASNVPDSEKPVIAFEKVVFEFGKVKEGDKVSHDFKFKNTGKTPLIISSAVATCGCTVPEPPKDPIKPGQESVIKVIFNSQGKPGLNDKLITVTSNAKPAQTVLHLIGEVTPAGK